MKNFCQILGRTFHLLVITCSMAMLAVGPSTSYAQGYPMGYGSGYGSTGGYAPSYGYGAGYGGIGGSAMGMYGSGYGSGMGSMGSMGYGSMGGYGGSAMMGGYGASGGYGGYGGMSSMGGMGYGSGMGSMGYGSMGGMGYGSMGGMGMGMGGMGGYGMTGMMNSTNPTTGTTTSAAGSVYGFPAMSPVASSFMLGSAGSMSMLYPNQFSMATGLGNFGQIQTGMNMSDNTGMAMMGLGIFGNIASNAISASSAMAQAAMLSEYMVKNGKGDPGLTRQDDFFPQCKTSVGIEPHPTNICKKGSTQNPLGQVATIKQFSSAQNKANGYKLAQDLGKEFNTPFGLQCVDREAQKFYDQLHQEQNRLQEMITLLNQQSQQKKLELESTLQKIADVNRELDGAEQEGGTGGNRKDKRLDFSPLFNNNSCRYAIDAAGITQGMGLHTIKNAMKPNQSLADNFLRDHNSGQLKKMVDSDVKALADLVKRDVSAPAGLNFPKIAELYNREREKMAFDYSQLRKQILEKIPGATAKLPENFIEFVRNSEEKGVPSTEYYKNLAVETCLDNPAETKPINELIDSIRQFDNNNNLIASSANESLNNYKNDLKRVFNKSYTNFATKLAEIKKITATYNLNFRINVPINDKTGSHNVDILTVDALNQSYKHCSTLYTSNPVEDGSTFSTADFVNEKVSNMRKMQQEMQTMPEKIAETATNQIIKCEGFPSPSNATDCTGALDKQSANFCIANAITCSSGINQCLKQADQEIQKREQNVQALAQNYNQQVSTIVNQQNKLLKSMYEQVKATADRLNKYFPGARFDVPANMQIEEPALASAKYGVELKGDGAFTFLDQMATQLTGMLNAMKTQEQGVKTKVDERRAQLAERYKTEQEFWTQLANDCEADLANYSQMINQAMTAANTQAQQQFLAARQFCNTLRFAQVGPGCQMQAQMLFNQYYQVSGALGFGSEWAKVAEYARTCNALAQSMMGGMTSGDPIVSMAFSPTGANLSQMCAMAGGSTEELLRRFSTTLRDNAVQFSIVINSKYPQLGGNFTTDNIMTLGQLDKYEFDRNGNVMGMKGLPRAELEKTAAGSFLITFAQMRKSLDHTVGNSGKRICEYAASLRAPGSPAYQTCNAQSAATAGSPVFGDASAITARTQILPMCLDQQVELTLSSMQDPKINQFKGSAAQLSILQQRVPMDVARAGSESLGQSPNTGCTGMVLSPRPASFVPPPSPYNSATGAAPSGSSGL